MKATHNQAIAAIKEFLFIERNALEPILLAYQSGDTAELGKLVSDYINAHAADAIENEYLFSGNDVAFELTEAGQQALDLRQPLRRPFHDDNAPEALRSGGVL
jgi:hypothetical protein